MITTDIRAQSPSTTSFTTFPIHHTPAMELITILFITATTVFTTLKIFMYTTMNFHMLTIQHLFLGTILTTTQFTTIWANTLILPTFTINTMSHILWIFTPYLMGTLVTPSQSCFLV